MEANLNQFRLLTVCGEQETSCRGSGGGRSRHPFGGTESNGATTATLAGHNCDVAGDSVPSAHSSPSRVRRRHTSTHPATRNGFSDDDDAELSDDEEDEATEADRRKTNDAAHSLVSALRSLEQTLNDHTLQLTNRLRRELTVKGVKNETTVQTGAGTSPSPAKSGQRGDKVEL